MEPNLTIDRPDPGRAAAALWVVVAGWLVLCGWGLSIAGQLNATGYLVALALFVAMAWIGRRYLAALWPHGNWWWRTRRRLRRPLPLAWMTCWLLAAVGGVLYPPNNIDAVTYRLPRMLHWLAAGHWQWIATNDPRMNYSAQGFEWLTLPALALGRSDRLFFLGNVLPALLLPGLFFSFLRSVGVHRGVAWRWMWLLPLGLGFMLQAGSIANDAPGAVYFLAACYFATCAARVRSRGDARNVAGSVWLGLSLVAAGLMTGVKVSNLPLLLPYGIMAARATRGLRPRLGVLVAAAVLALSVSAFPTLAINWIHTGKIGGDPEDLTGMKLDSPLHGLVGNSVQGVLQNTVPPVWPWAVAWNRWSAREVEPGFRRWLGGDFPRFTLRLGELPHEEWDGLGLFMWLALLGGLWLGNSALAQPERSAPRDGTARAVVLGGIVAVLVYAVVMASEMTARLLLPYYPVLAAGLLRWPGQAAWCRTRSWRILAAGAVAAIMLALIVSPGRPLLPVQGLTAWLQRHYGEKPLFHRAAESYGVYARRHDPLASFREALPAGTEKDRVGFYATMDDSELSLWQPYGGREVVDIRRSDTPAGVRDGGVRWLVVRADAMWKDTAAEAEWLRLWRGEIVVRQKFLLKASRSPEDWALVQLH